MDENKIIAIVGNSITYKDNDAIVKLLTRGYGNILATAKSVKKADAKLKYAASVFNVGHYMLCGRSNTIRECVQIEGFPPLVEDVEKYYTGCYILENFGKINQKTSDVKLFDSVIDVLIKLTYGDIPPIDSKRNFLLSILKSGGLDITFNKCSVCGIDKDILGYDIDSGIVCKNCGNSNQTITIPNEIKKYYCGEDVNLKVKGDAISLLEEIIYYYMGIKIYKNKYRVDIWKWCESLLFYY